MRPTRISAGCSPTLRRGRPAGPSPPLLAASPRPWAGALAACCAVLVAVLGVLVAGQTQPDRFDRAVDAPVITWFAGHQGLALWLAFPASTIPAAVLSAVIVITCLLTGRPNGAVLAALAVPAVAALNDGLIKHLVHRTYLGLLSYPSGHTATMSALAATLTVLLLIPPRPATARLMQRLIPAVACLLAIVVAIGVIGLRWHYFTDTVAGAAEGIATVAALALLLDLPPARQRLDRLAAYIPLTRPTAQETQSNPGLAPEAPSPVPPPKS
jgi:membrane-associated phospholipid phosphatase